HFGLSMSSPQIKVLDTWDCLGMRGTGSHDIEIDGAFVPNEKVALKRPAGLWHPLFQIIGTIAFPLIYSVYLGVAESAAALALETARRKPADARQRRLAGHMETELAAAGFAREAMVAEAERNEPGEISINRVMIGRRLVEEHAIRAVELAMELAGGGGFYRGSGLERHFRDIQGARYHPMLPEVQYEYAGALALGQPVANIY
ncbi:MAG TPA: acyl-CoA dehydrogenase family protein, partial [Paracoccaceae bacterium]|nr:acyl-CoA dehydrogenase family protein [Paracoccaceae bacterium]